ncbi:SNF2 family N-terminal domain-containing protein [Chaetomium tenue]|uniref:SNF2 family N-terminal domain-containing protein n=1 Tax=Chaetomium tenue TaxID=1854479 RepID=A0ACB7P2X2_9PEZI|nr:SNF2 family N-terminal domain-containing protein [Chaetomium globosum]
MGSPQAINTPTIQHYISPAPSRNPSCSHHASPAPTQVPGELNGWFAANEGPKNAKEYWKQAYGALRQPGLLKRKRNGDTENKQAKRHQGRTAEKPESPGPHQVDNESSSPDPTTGVGHADNASLHLTEQHQEMQQFLGVDVNLDDPQTRGDLHKIYNAAMSFGQSGCKLVGGKWQLGNFSTSLYHHQLIGVSWMLSREFHPAAPTGGILADEMGLGKTVQLLACMSQNMAGKNSKASKTLIIAPKRLITQWCDEINAHCSHKKMKRVYIYAAGAPLMKVQWKEAGIVITNYSQLQRQLPSPAELEYIEELKEKRDAKWRDNLRRYSKGLLFQTDWHRVVLDEAHAINNRASRTSRACRLLLRRYSWVLSGTPLTNDTDEFFPYLDFIRSKYSNFGGYHDAMGNIANPILEVPENRPTELITVEFSPTESDLYHRANVKLHQLREQARNRKAGGGFITIPNGELRKWYNYLRFFTSHPALVEPTYINQQALQPHAPEITGVEGSAAGQESHYFCRACCNALVEPLIGNCGHAFCKACVKKSQIGSKQDRHCLSCGKAPGPILSEAGKEYYRHTSDYFENLKRKFSYLALSTKDKRKKRFRKPGDDEFGLQPRLGQREKARKGRGKGGKTTKGRKGKGRRARKKKDDIERIRGNAGVFLRECDKRPWDPIPHSAKTRETMALVNKWQQEALDDKIIIFIQWIPMLSFLGRMLFQNGIKYVYFWGEMDSNDQEMSIRAFQQVPEIKVMLISVSCGAHGLNLTAANRAIVFDHWWHEGLERQAFARVHRIGQTKTVHTVKLVAAGSMDETILGMQARKRETIGLAVGDGPARGTHDEDGTIDQEMLDLTRLDDIDEESEGDGGSDDDSSSDTDGDADTDTDSADDLSGDEGEDKDDSDYEGASDTDAAVLGFGGPKTRSGTSGEAQDEESEDDTDLEDE